MVEHIIMGTICGSPVMRPTGFGFLWKFGIFKNERKLFQYYLYIYIIYLHYI